jgi:DNA-binding FrmR family transcriptional regulator
MKPTEREKQKLVARIHRIRGQVESIERSLTEDDDCAAVLMLLANIRGGINSLMGEVRGERAETKAVAEDVIDLVRAYLK